MNARLTASFDRTAKAAEAQYKRTNNAAKEALRSLSKKLAKNKGV